MTLTNINIALLMSGFLVFPRWHLDRDAGVRVVLGLGERGDGRRDPLQRPGLRRRAQTGAEGEDGLNLRVWEAARSRRVFILLSGLEPVLTMKARGQTGRSAALHTRILSHRHPIIPWALGQLQSGTMRDLAQSSSYRDVCESAVKSESRSCFLMKKTLS